MPFSHEVYDPDTLAILTKAFDAAWQEVQRADLTTLINDAANTRTIMAPCIMSAANQGERDPGRLTLIALHAVDGRPVDG